MHLSREVPPTQTKVDLWHSRLGHQGQQVLNQVNTQHKINLSSSDLKQAEQSPCLTCVRGKAIRQPIHSVADPQYKATYPLQCVHVRFSWACYHCFQTESSSMSHYWRKDFRISRDR